MLLPRDLWQSIPSQKLHIPCAALKVSQVMAAEGCCQPFAGNENVDAAPSGGYCGADGMYPGENVVELGGLVDACNNDPQELCEQVML